MIETKSLEYFIALAETLHFSRAAERVHISQSALSQQLRGLEQTIGAKLLDRTSRQISLTQAGQLFLEEARLVLAHLSAAVQQAQRAERGEIGQIRIGFVGSLLYSFLPGVFQTFRQHYPQVELQLEQLSSQEQYERLARQELDLGLLYHPGPTSFLDLETLHETALVAVLPKQHPRARGARLRVADLHGLPLVLADRAHEPAVHDCTLRLFSRQGSSPQVSQRAGEVHTVLGLVASGFGVFVGPEYVEHIAHPALVCLPLEEPLGCLRLAAAWPRGQASPLRDNFLQVVRAALAVGSL